MTTKLITIEVVSDFACPWCLVGLHRLRKAIDQRPSLEIELTWQPFQLNPQMPREGRNRREYYRDKFTAERADVLRATLNSAGAEEGIVFCDEPAAMAPNTLSAHVLMFWAARQGNIDTNALAEQLFNAHHIACENIGDIDILTRIAGEAGMDTALVAAKLASGDGEERVKDNIRQNAARGVSAVPFFIFNGRYGISGAQPPDTLALVLDRSAGITHQ